MEQKENIIQSLTYEFALESIKIYKNLTLEKKEFVLSKQFLRSATSIGANVEEALGGQSRKDFIAKLSISQKEAKETYYWLRLLHDSDFIGGDIFKSTENKILAIIKILSKILITSKSSGE